MTTPDDPGARPGDDHGPVGEPPQGQHPGAQGSGRQSAAAPEPAGAGAGADQGGSWAPPAGSGWVGSPAQDRSPDAGPPAPAPETRAPRRGPGWGGVIVVALVAALLAGGLATAIGFATRPDPPVVDQTAATSSEPAQSADPAQSVPITEAVNWNTLAQRVKPSVVSIRVAGLQGGGEGTGVVVDKLGHVLTNNHVATAGGPQGEIQVTLSDGRLYAADIVGTDPSTDLAVLQVREAPDDLTPAVFGRSSEVQVGQQVMAVGNPLGLSDTVTTGIVSALNRPVITPVAGQETQPSPFGGQGGQGGQGSDGFVVTNAIQTDTAINAGNSGGPLVDATGRVIGINSSIASPSAGAGAGAAGSVGLGFAIPADEAKRVSAELVAEGTATHARLGVNLATQAGTPTTEDGTTRLAATVTSVEPGSAAAEAGLLEGDEIVAADDVPTPGPDSLIAIVRERAPDDRMTLTLVRDGQEQDVTVQLGAQEQ